MKLAALDSSLFGTRCGTSQLSALQVLLTRQIG